MLSWLMLLFSVFAVLSSWAGLLRYKKRMFYVYIFVSSITLIFAVAFVYDISSPSFSVYGDVNGFVENTNPVLLEGLHVVDFTRSSVPVSLFEDTSDNAGEYNPANRRIIVVPVNASYAWFDEFSWWHELGHHVWHWHLTDEEREVWKGMYAKDMYIEEAGEFPYFTTDYAKTSYGEDFSESFARWVYDYSDGEQYARYKTENLDPDRKYILMLFMRRFLGDSCSEYVDPVECMRVTNVMVIE